jgi:TRAP-type uncharacterized transport system fused permease subunit
VGGASFFAFFIGVFGELTPPTSITAVHAALAAMSHYILFSFNDIASDVVSAGVLAVIAYWIVVRRPLVAAASPEPVVLKTALAPSPAAGGAAE